MKKIIPSQNLIPYLCALSVAFANCTDRNNDSADHDSPVYAIAYNVLTDAENDNYEVFSMNPDGSDKTNVTNLEGVEWTYLSCQDNLYFISDMDTCHRCYFLYKTDYRGNNPVRVYDVRLADSWMSSRNSCSELIIKPDPRIDSAFHVIDHLGNLIHRLVTGLPYASDPLFVNDGNQVVFRGGLTRSKLVEGFDEALYIIDMDGQNRHRLTHYPVEDTTAGKFAYRAGPPRQHPTEHFISFQSKQDGKYSLYAITIDGVKQWKLTDISQNEGWHDWSSDGKWLVVELFDDDQTQFHIGLMDWETKEMQVLTDTTYRYQQAPNFVLKNKR